MITSIEMQVISCILTSKEPTIVQTLLGYDSSYYSVFQPHINFIFKHKAQNGTIPDTFTFQMQFPDFVIVEVHEPLSYLESELRINKKHNILVETFNRLQTLGEADTEDAWEYLGQQYQRVSDLDASAPMNIVKEAEKRANQVVEYSKRTRIPTGFDAIDKAMYGGLSTVEELLLLLARTGNGKSWICTELMESAQKHGFPVLYYSPEMQSSFLATRFDTWRKHFPNSQIYRGNYSDEYNEYIKELSKDSTDAFVMENKDAPDNMVTVPFIQKFVRKHGIKLVVIDGLSYMTDHRSKRNDGDYNKYKNICEDLFNMSKQCGCAVVVVAQANRATKESKDDKGEPFPNLFNVEGSDHPARICTQAFAIRQIFDRHILDIRLEKSRNAMNQKPIFTYSWDINTGTLEYMPNADDLPTVSTPVVDTGFKAPDALKNLSVADIELDLDEDVEF